MSLAQEQKLRPGEKIDMPVFFYVDPEFATDPRMKRVNHLTLSYTFFKVRLSDIHPSQGQPRLTFQFHGLQQPQVC